MLVPLTAARRTFGVLLAVSAVLILGAVCAVNAHAASYRFTGVTADPSALQAGGHSSARFIADPDAANADGNGGDDVKKLVIDYAAGQVINSRVVTSRCTATQLAGNSCPSASAIGKISAVWRVSGLSASTSGIAYAMTTTPSGADAGIGFVLSGTSVRRFTMSGQLGLGLVSRPAADAAFGPQLTLDGIPRTLVSSIGLTLNGTLDSLTIELGPRVGNSTTGAYVSTVPTSCAALTGRATATTYGSLTAAASDNYTPTGCATVKFTPTQVLSGLTAGYGQPTGFNYGFTLPAADAATQQSQVKSASIALPAGSSISYPAVAALIPCGSSALASDACPAGSSMGTVSLQTPLAASALSGSVYLLANGTAPSFGYVVRTPNGILTGQGKLQASGRLDIDSFPAIPIASFGLNLSAKVLSSPASCSPGSATTTLVGTSGASATGTFAWPPAVCDPPPTVAITSPPNNSSTSAATTNVAFTVNGASSIPAGVNCAVNGAPTSSATANTVNLVIGANSIVVSCTDAFGTGSATATVTRGVPPAVVITSPSSASGGTSTTVNVAFTVNGAASIPAGTVCTINGTATTSATTNTFAVHQGSNAITVACTNQFGTTAVSLIYVIDPPPNVQIVSPANNSNTASASVNVVYTVNGATSIPVNTTCSVANTTTGTVAASTSATTNSVTLAFGPNTITTTCTNAFGSGSSTVVVNYGLPAPQPVFVSPPTDPTYTPNQTTQIQFTLNGTSTVPANTTCTVNTTGGSTTTISAGSATTATVSLTMGANTVTVTCSNPFGAATASRTIVRGAIPTVAITSPPTNPANSSTSPINVAYTVDGSPSIPAGTTCVVANTATGSSSASTTPLTNSVALQTGANVITVTCTNAFGSMTVSTVVNYGGPGLNPTFTVPSSNPTYVTSAVQTVQFTVAGTSTIPSGVSCVLTNTATGSSTAFSSGMAAAASVALLNGSNLLSLTCSNSSESATRTTTVVKGDPPPVVITSPANNSWTNTSPVNVSFTVGSTQIPAGTSCTVNGASTSDATTNPVDLAAGPNTIHVTCANQFGAQTATVTVNYDTVPPSIGPISLSQSTSPGPATITYSASDASGTPTCTPPSGSATNLTTGTNVITVTCTDRASNSATASVVITISGSGSLVVTINSGPTGNTSNPTPTFTWSANQPESGPLPCAPGQTCAQVIVPYLEYACTMDGSNVGCGGNSYTSPTLQPGQHNFCVTGHGIYSGLYSAPACRSFTLVTGPQVPAVTITSGPSGATNQSAPTFTFISDQTGAIFECQIDGGQWFACNSPYTFSGLQDGVHTFCVRATNSAGTSPPACRTFTVDRQPPVITVNCPVIADAAFRSCYWTVSDPTPPITVTCTRDGVPLNPCPNPIDFSGAGNHTLTITATDGVGNAGTSGLNFTIQPPPPFVLITSPPSGTVTGSSSINVTYTINGSTSIPPNTVCTVTTSSGTYPSTSTTNNPVSLQMGANTIQVTCSNPFGSYPASPITVTRVIPSITISAPVNGSTTTASEVPFTYTTTGFGAGLTCSRISGVNVALTVGTNMISVSCYDSVGNNVTASTTVTRQPLAGFAPDFLQTYPSDSSGDSTTGLTISLNNPAGSNPIKTAVVSEPSELEINVPALGYPQSDMCPANSVVFIQPSPTFIPNNCPQSAKVGVATLSSPSFPSDVHGTIYVVNRPGSILLGVDFLDSSLGNPPVASVSRMVLNGPNTQVDPQCLPENTETGICADYLKFTITGFPDVQELRSTFVVDGGRRTSLYDGSQLSGKLFRWESYTCDTVTAQARLTSVANELATLVTPLMLPPCTVG